MARLVITSESGERRFFALSPGETTLGRAASSQVVIEGEGVSRAHACIAGSASGFELKDLGSKNGTFLNGARIEASQALTNGDTVTIPGWTIRFEAEEATVTRSFVPGAAAATDPAGRSLVLKPETKEVLVRGATVLLAPKEYLALSLLYERAGKIVSKEDLADHVWPEYKGDVSDYNIHQVLSRLRRELEEDPSKPRILITRPGFGYMLVL
ncbi:MAG: winged helix-turn-helix domain-containing protein [bacterium]